MYCGFWSVSAAFRRRPDLAAAKLLGTLSGLLNQDVFQICFLLQILDWLNLFAIPEQIQSIRGLKKQAILERPLPANQDSKVANEDVIGYWRPLERAFRFVWRLCIQFLFRLVRLDFKLLELGVHRADQVKSMLLEVTSIGKRELRGVHATIWWRRHNSTLLLFRKKSGFSSSTDSMGVAKERKSICT